ncbi:MAG TPA: PAS domain S-box protein [Gammaproteobacteria bacterium]|nr:PAS domain S-box protein [Gammaproteobacteria bacterium]
MSESERSLGYLLIAVAAVVGLAILGFDFLVPLGVAAAVPYVLLVLLGLWMPWRSASWLLAVTATALTILGYAVSYRGGEPHWVVLTNRLLALTAIWITAVLCYMQRRVTDTLEDDEERLRGLIDTSNDTIVAIDTRGTIRMVNPACREMFGYREDELIGRNVKMLMPSPHHEQHDEYLDRYLRTGERRIIGIGREVDARRKDGSLFPVILAVGEVRLRNERLFTGFLHDISRRNSYEQQVRQLQSELFRVSRVTELGAMTSSIAHETNQPLAAISTYLYALRRLLQGGEDGASPRIEEIIDKAQAQTQRASQVIRQIRQMTRAGDDRHEAEDLNALVEEAIEIGLIGLADEELAVERALDPDLPACRCNRIQIQQVVMNLVRNAVEAMSDSRERRLTVRTWADGGTAHVSVSDTGPGIPEQVRERLFQPFVTSKSDGIGIGLSICRSIVENHGGRLTLERPEHGGTRFVFTVPPAGEGKDEASAGTG